MRPVSSNYVDSGRSRQKSRTRQALVDAARQLVADGVTPTVEQAAEAAGTSRTTAYRYFTNQRELLGAAHPETVTTTLLPEDAPVDAPGRLSAVLSAFTTLTAQTEAQQRTMLRLSLTDAATPQDLPLRQGRAVPWIAQALEPLADELSPAHLQRLAVAIRSVAGIEARVWLTDVGGLTPDETSALQQWAGQALLAHAVRTPPPLPGPVRSTRHSRSDRPPA